MTYYLGVDLGTSYTAAAISRDGVLELVSLGTRSLEIPSVAFLDSSGSVVVGESAERRGASDPTRLAREFKRRLGDPAPILVSGTPFSAEALMAAVLRSVVADITRRQGEPPVHVTLTRPANWGPYKQELFSHVPVLADLGASSTATEPEAAAVHFASTTRVSSGQSIAVYDLGGGTFDAAVLRKTDDGFATMGTPEGIEHLGGADFDDAVFEYVRRVLGTAFSQLDPTDPAVRNAAGRLRAECVLAKESLSRDTEAAIPVALPGLQTEVRLTRQDFEDLVRPALMSTVESLRRTVRSARVPVDEIAATVLAGGSSRIPLVAELITGELQLPVAVGTHPKHTVALGAALLAARDAGRVGVDEPTGRWTPGMIAPVLPSGPVPTVDPSSGPVPVGATWDTDQKAAATPPPGPAVAAGESESTSTGSGLFGMPNQTGVLHPASGRRRRSLMLVGASVAVAAILVGTLLVTKPWRSTAAAGSPTVGTVVQTPTGSTRSSSVPTSTSPQPSSSSPSTSSSPTASSQSSSSSSPTFTPISGIPTGVSCALVTIAVPGMYSNPPELPSDAPPATREDQLAIRVRDAVKLAVDQFNRANPQCTVTVTTPDTKHDDKNAGVVAKSIVKDPTVLASVVASYSSEVNHIAPVYQGAGLGFVVPLSKAPGLNQGNKWSTFNRVSGDDQMAGRSIPKFLQEGLDAQRVLLIGDGEGHSPGIDKQVISALGDKLVAHLVIPRHTEDFSDLTDEIAAKQPDAVYFSGDPRFGGTVLTAIRDGGYTGTVILTESLYEARFMITGSNAAEGALFGCTCAPPDGNPEMTGGPEFHDAYVKKYHVEPTDYAAEAFDATLIILNGLKDGASNRADMATFIRSYSGPGITKDLSFNDDGDITGDPYFVYTMKDGKPQFTAFVR